MLKFRNLFFTILICVLYHTGISCNNYLSKKNISSLLVGTAIAFVGHNILEFISTLIHELGHASINKLFTGDPLKIVVKKNPNISARALIPWIGYSTYNSYQNNNSKVEAIVTAAGPLAGITSTFTQLLLIYYLEKHLTKSNENLIKEIFPLTFFKRLYKASYKNAAISLNMQKADQANLSIFDVAINVLKFLRFSRIAGESLYGFAPISIEDGIGDGQHLWKILLNKSKDEYPSISKNLLILTGGIMTAPIIFGINKAAIDCLIKKNIR